MNGIFFQGNFKLEEGEFLFMNDHIRRRGAGGYTLVEVMLVVMIIGILAGCVMLAISRNSDNAEAAVILSDLDAAKSALLAYSMEHRTRASDRLEEFIGANSSVIVNSLDNYMSAQVSAAGSKAKARFDKIDIDTMVDVNTGTSKVIIGFAGFPADRGLINALQRKTASGQNASHYRVTHDASGTACTVWLDVK
jgi:prepilin-type N-terminal cleavage/methylation domain-containing protein